MKHIHKCKKQKMNKKKNIIIYLYIIILERNKKCKKKKLVREKEKRANKLNKYALQWLYILYIKCFTMTSRDVCIIDIDANKLL